MHYFISLIKSAMRKSDAIKYVLTDLESDPKLMAACLKIIEYLSTRTLDNLARITFGTLGSTIGSNDPEEIILAAQYLSGARVNLLEPRFFLDLNGEEIKLDLNTVAYARNFKKLINPETGKEVLDYEKHIFMDFALASVNGRPTAEWVGENAR